MRAFIERVEKAHFRTNEDTGANQNAMLIWNLVRAEAGLPPLDLRDLPAYCETHKMYHVIRADYGCVVAGKEVE
jgi:hypothetical protein